MASSDSREIPAGDDRGCGVVGGVLLEVRQRGRERVKVELHLALMDWYRHGETLHAVYLTMLSVCAYHIKNHKCRERSQKKRLLPSLNNTRAVRADLCGTKVSARGEKCTLSCVTH